jgi:hypothetical protein
MEDVTKQVTSIEGKVRILIEAHKEITKKLTEYEIKFQKFKEESEKQNKIINELTEKIKLLKIAKTVEKKEGIADAKLKINELVREIDRCIGLLQT